MEKKQNIPLNLTALAFLAALGLLTAGSVFASTHRKYRHERSTPVAQTVPAPFGAYEKFDMGNPTHLPRLLAAFSADPIAQSLIDSVLSQTGKAILSDLIEFKDAMKAGEGGFTSVTQDRNSPDAALPGWIGVDSNGSLFVSPNARLNIRVEIQANATFIDVYTTIIHELTHVSGALARARTENLDDVLNYTSAVEFATRRIEETGGEVDAFAAETSALIRYKNRYDTNYDIFPVISRVRFFDLATGELKDRAGFEDSIAKQDGAYYPTSLSEAFKAEVASELQYDQALVAQLKRDPNYALNAGLREEASRLEIRAERVQTQFGLK